MTQAEDQDLEFSDANPVDAVVCVRAPLRLNDDP